MVLAGARYSTPTAARRMHSLRSGLPGGGFCQEIRDTSAGGGVDCTARLRASRKKLRATRPGGKAELPE